MAIEREKIESIKQGIDLAALVRAEGIQLKKNGKSYFGLCPFHDDTNPSLSVNPSPIYGSALAAAPAVM